MAGGSNGCIGCDENFYENNYGSVMFKIMHIKHGRDEYGPQRVRKMDSVIRIHRKCLAEHVWKVRQYADSHEFSDIEIEQWLNGEELKQQLIPANKNSWALRFDKEGGFMRDHRGFVFNKDVDKLLKRMIEKQDLCFVTFIKDNYYSPPVIYSMDDPLIASHTSTPEYKKNLKKAIEEYKKQCVVINKIDNDPKEKILDAGSKCVIKFGIFFSDSNNATKSNPNETDAHVKEASKAVPPSDDDPIKILKTRYAKGEISKEEFEEMKKDLA